MPLSAFGMALEGDLEADGFLFVSKLFPGGPVAASGQGVQEGDVLLMIGEVKLAGHSEQDVKRLVADTRTRPRISLKFGRQFALAAGRTIEPFTIEVSLAAVPDEVEEWDESEIVELGKKANKKSARAKKAADKASKVKTRLRAADQPVGPSKYAQMVAAAPPIWRPPPPEYPCPGVAATKRRASGHEVCGSRVWACGDNSQGELGLGHRRFIWGAKAVHLARSFGKAAFTKSTPHCAAGEGFSIMCTGCETAVSGTNVNGRLGLKVGVVESFTRIPCLSGIAVNAVACGHDHVVLLAKGTVPRTFVWGGNAHGQLGLGWNANALCEEPTEVVTLRGKSFSQVAAGKAHTLLLSGDGCAVWTFGAHEHGQLGRPLQMDSNAFDEASCTACVPTPLGLLEDADAFVEAHDAGAAETVTESGQRSAVDRIVVIAAGAHHSMLITRRGTVLTFGRNDAGQCGFRSPATLMRPRKMPLPPTDHAQLGACGALHSVIVCHDRDRPAVCSVYSCGSGGSWQLGSGLSQQDRYEPELVETMAGRRVTAVACGMFHTLCMVDQDGESSLWAWGADLFGDTREVDATNATDGRTMRGSDIAARGLAGRVLLKSCQQSGVQIKNIVAGPSARHSFLLLALQLPWHLERVLWIGLLKGEGRCQLARLPLDGPRSRTSFLLMKIIEMVCEPR